MPMKACLVEVTSHWQQPQHTLHTLCLVLAAVHHQHLQCFDPYFVSPIHAYPIKQTTARTHMSHLINTRAKEKNSIESIATKIKNETCFSIFLWNDQWTFDNNGSFNVKNKIYFLFYVFVILSNYYGYLFIITITTYNIGTTISQDDKCAALIVSLIKNKFDICGKSWIWLNFWYLLTHIQHMLLIFLIRFVVTYKFSLHYHYLKNYQLHHDWILFDFNNRYYSYKNIVKYAIVRKNESKNSKLSTFYCCKTTMTRNNMILCYSKYVCMLIYF